MINIKLKGKTMRINEMNTPAEELFEDSATKQVLDVALSGNTVWSKPMSLEQAIALTMGKPHPDKTRDGNPNVRTNKSL